MDHAVAHGLIELVRHLRLDIYQSTVATFTLIDRFINERAVSIEALVDGLALHVFKTNHLAAGTHLTTSSKELREANIGNHIILSHQLCQYWTTTFIFLVLVS